MVILRANGVGKRYQMGKVTVHALDGVDFAVGQGKFVAVMGPPGSGKSTLLHLLGGLDAPSDSKVMLAGQRLLLLKDKTVTILHFPFCAKCGTIAANLPQEKVRQHERT